MIARTPNGYDLSFDNSYVLTEDDVFDGLSIMGVDVRRIPLGVPLCGTCDNPLDGSVCHSCQVIHVQSLTEVHGDPMKRRAA